MLEGEVRKNNHPPKKLVGEHRLQEAVYSQAAASYGRAAPLKRVEHRQSRECNVYPRETWRKKETEAAAKFLKSFRVVPYCS